MHPRSPAASSRRAQRRRAMEGVDPAVSDAYFSELLSYPLERLSKEPELLRQVGRATAHSEPGSLQPTAAHV